MTPHLKPSYDKWYVKWEQWVGIKVMGRLVFNSYEHVTGITK